MRLPYLLPAVILALTSPLRAAPQTAASASARVTPAPAQIRLEMRLTRTEQAGAAGAGANSAGDAAAVSPALPAMATPTLTTLDRGTATVSVTSKDLSYTISASPSLEQADKPGSTVQVLWNVRLSGRALPEGTNSVATTGATRIDPKPGTETTLTELPVRDSKTGAVSVFRLAVRVLVTGTTASGPQVGPVPPVSPPTP